MTRRGRRDGDGEDGLTEKQLRHIREMCADAPPMPPEVRERVAAADDRGGDVRTLTERQELIIDWIAGGDADE